VVPTWRGSCRHNMACKILIQDIACGLCIPSHPHRLAILKEFSRLNNVISLADAAVPSASGLRQSLIVRRDKTSVQMYLPHHEGSAVAIGLEKVCINHRENTVFSSARLERQSTVKMTSIRLSIETKFVFQGDFEGLVALSVAICTRCLRLMLEKIRASYR
jgi:hypothetical protein